MGIRGIAKRAGKSLIKPLDEVKDYGSRVIDQGRTLANTKGTEAQRFADSPGGFSAYLPKPARGAVGLFLPKPRDVVNAYRQEGTSGFIEQAKVNLQIATAPLAGAGIAKGAGAVARAGSAFGRAPRVAAILRAANSELGAARIPGGRLRTAADLATSRGVRPKSTPGANIAAATARLEAIATGAAKPASQVVSRAGSTVAAKAPSGIGRAAGGIAQRAKGAMNPSFLWKDPMTAVSRVRSAEGAGATARAAAGVVVRGSTTYPLRAYGHAGGAVVAAYLARETFNQTQDAFRGNTVRAGSNAPGLSSDAKGLMQLAEAYSKSSNKDAFVKAIVAGYKAAEPAVKALTYTAENDDNFATRGMARKKADDVLRKSVKAFYPQKPERKSNARRSFLPGMPNLY